MARVNEAAEGLPNQAQVTDLIQQILSSAEGLGFLSDYCYDQLK